MLRHAAGRQGAFRGRVYIQLLGVVDEDNDAKLPAVVAGRFLPMVEDPAWFSSAEAQAQKVGEEKAPKVELKRGSRLEFDYPSMKDLGQLTCCRIWHDHKKDAWHLMQADVHLKDSSGSSRSAAAAAAAGGDSSWTFPCNDWVKDETRPVPQEFTLPLHSQGDDALQEMMERKREADLEHGFSQQLGMTDEQVRLFATSRNILKRQLRAERGMSTLAMKGTHPANPRHDDKQPHQQEMSAVHLAMKEAVATKMASTLEAENAELRERCAWPHVYSWHQSL